MRDKASKFTLPVIKKKSANKTHRNMNNKDISRKQTPLQKIVDEAQKNDEK